MHYVYVDVSDAGLCGVSVGRDGVFLLSALSWACRFVWKVVLVALGSAGVTSLCLDAAPHSSLPGSEMCAFLPGMLCCLTVDCDCVQ
jgi:hypothetical protein